MSNRVVLLDLAHIVPTAAMLKPLLEHNSLVFMFHAAGQFQYALEDLTELASWISSGQLMILEIPEVEQRSYEYAVLVGQLLALVEQDCQIQLYSASAERDLLLQFLHEAHFESELIALQPQQQSTDALKVWSWSDLLAHSQQTALVSLSPYLQHVALRRVVGRGVAYLSKQAHFGQQVASWMTQRMQRIDARIAVLQPSSGEAMHADLTQQRSMGMPNAMQSSGTDTARSVAGQNQSSSLHAAERLSAMDLMHIEVIRKVNDAAEMPKDIYELRDLLEKSFPEADVGMLLKTLIDQGYIYWNGHEVVYSHEMYLN